MSIIFHEALAPISQNVYIKKRSTMDRATKRFIADESEQYEGNEMADECLVSELECNECGGPVNGNCDEHGDTEVALYVGHRLRCNEWNYDTGRECRHVLMLKCEDCGNEEIEI